MNQASKPSLRLALGSGAAQKTGVFPALLIVAILAGGLPGCWRSKTLTPARSTPESAGYGLTAHTFMIGPAAASVVAIGNASHSHVGPGEVWDSRWSVEAYSLVYCRNAGETAICESVDLEDGKPPDIPRIVEPTGLGGFDVVSGGVSGGVVEGDTTRAPVRTTATAVPRNSRALPNRGVWLIATPTIYFCSVQDDGPFCRKAKVDSDDVRAMQVLASTVIRRGTELGGVIWTNWLGKVVRCEAWLDGIPQCAVAEFDE